MFPENCLQKLGHFEITTFGNFACIPIIFLLVCGVPLRICLSCNFTLVSCSFTSNMILSSFSIFANFLLFPTKHSFVNLTCLSASLILISISSLHSVASSFLLNFAPSTVSLGLSTSTVTVLSAPWCRVIDSSLAFARIPSVRLIVSCNCTSFVVSKASVCLTHFHDPVGGARFSKLTLTYGGTQHATKRMSFYKKCIKNHSLVHEVKISLSHTVIYLFNIKLMCQSLNHSP